MPAPQSVKKLPKRLRIWYNDTVKGGAAQMEGWTKDTRREAVITDLGQHRTMRLRHLPDKMRLNLVIFS